MLPSVLVSWNAVKERGNEFYAWLLVLQTAAGLIWGQTAYHRPVRLVSIQGFTFPGTSVVVGWDEFSTIVVALGLAFGTAAVLRWTTFGTSMRAVADDPDSARLWGIDVNRVMAVSWVAGSAAGGGCGRGRTAISNRAAVRLPLSYPLPARRRTMCRRDAGIARGRTGSIRGLPLSADLSTGYPRAGVCPRRTDVARSGQQKTSPG